MSSSPRHATAGRARLAASAILCLIGVTASEAVWLPTGRSAALGSPKYAESTHGHESAAAQRPTVESPLSARGVMLLNILQQIRCAGRGADALAPAMREEMLAMLRTRVRVRPGGTLTLLDSGMVHVVESCGVNDASCAHGREDPHVPWFVMAADAGPAQPCPTPAPYAPRPYAAGVPNPNTPDPAGVHAIVTRHWQGLTIPYYVNIPATSGVTGATDIFSTQLPPPAPPFPAVPFSYTWDNFSADVQAVLSNTAGISTAKIPTPVFMTTTGTDYDASAQASPNAIISGSSQFIWAGNGTGGPCGGPTGDGQNEFIFLRFSALGGVVGGLTSMLLDPLTGAISECDVIFERSPALPQQWGTTGPRFSTGIPHEIGHFFGLDHTNLHSGALNAFLPNPYQMTPIAPFSASVGILYSSANQVPAMAASYTVNDAVSRITNPWRVDDITGLSVVYPVQSAFGTNIPLINKSATIRGSVVGLDPSQVATRGVFGMSVYVINRPSTTPLETAAPPGVPPVGTISGIARLSVNSVTGGGDTFTTARPTGDFCLEGIYPADATPIEYDLVVEPLECIGLTNSQFGEWWVEPDLNPALNVYAPLNAQVRLVSNSGPVTSYTNLTPLGLGSMAVVAGTIIDLEEPIDLSAGSGVRTVVVSRPVIDIRPRGYSAPPAGSWLTLTVHHNRIPAPGTGATLPLQSLRVTCNGIGMRTRFVSTGPSAFGAWNESVYQALMPTPVPLPAIIEATALEIPGLAGEPPSVSGRSQVRF